MLENSTKNELMNGLQYVGFWSRVWATVVDSVIFIMIVYPIFYLIYGDTFLEKSSDFTTLNTVINYIFPFVSVVLLWKSKGATPGKMLIKATIVDATSFDEPTTKQLVVRYFAYILSMIPLFLGYFWAGWDARKQTWHDKLAHTVVVQPKSEKQASTTKSYLGIGMAVFAAVAFVLLMVFGFMVKRGDIPDAHLYTKAKLPSAVVLTLREKNVLSKDEKLVYFQPHSMLSFTGSATVFTNNAIHYFETESDDKVNLWSFPFANIGNLTLETSKVSFGVVLITMTIYDENGEMLFTVGLTPNHDDINTFNQNVMDFWKNARKK